MSKNKKREGFDYFIDKYELSYVDSNKNETYYESESFDEAIPGFDRFRKFNRYTGDAIGSKQYVENFVSSKYLERDKNFDSNKNGGTVEFSAIPGQGGLNPNKRPLGDETMLFSNIHTANNPYVARLIENQQMNNDEITKKINVLNSQMDAVVQKIDNVSRIINNVTDEIKHTSTISFNTNTHTRDFVDTTNLSNTEIMNAVNVSDTNLLNTSTSTLDLFTNNDNATQKTSSSASPIISENKSNAVETTMISEPTTVEVKQEVIPASKVITSPAPITTLEVTSTPKTHEITTTSEINFPLDETITTTKTTEIVDPKEVYKKTKLSSLVIFGIIVWVIIIVALVVVGILIMTDVIKIK